MSPVRFIFHKQTLWLSPARCIFWEEKKILIVSDLHLGKSGHFRKSGIAIPQNIYKEDLQKLFSQIQFFKPEMLLITGDMFHSSANKELEFFKKWRADFSQVKFFLVKGNHDILPDSFYRECDIHISKDNFTLNPFCFTHDIDKTCDGEKNESYTFSGHIHPGIKMQGAGNQSLMLPCFYFGAEYAILPAFSAFTGLAKIRPFPSDQIFVTVKNEVMRLQ